MVLQVQKKKHIDFDLTQVGADEREEMSKMYDETLKNFAEGSIVPGKVLEVRSNEVLVDIGYKSEGVIDGHEFAKLSEVEIGINVLDRGFVEPVDIGRCFLFLGHGRSLLGQLSHGAKLLAQSGCIFDGRILIFDLRNSGGVGLVGIRVVGLSAAAG